MKWKAAVRVAKDGTFLDLVDYTNETGYEIDSWSEHNLPFWHGDVAYSDPNSAWWYVEYEEGDTP